LRRLDAVTFDFWNTLVHEAPGELSTLRKAAWVERLGSAGIAVADHELDLAMEGSWRRYVDAWHANRQYLALEAAHDLLTDLGLGELEPALRDALIADFTTVGERAELELTPNVADCLRTLHDTGLRIGIVCDVGMTPSTILRAHLERHGVLDLFDHWSFSDEVGWYKPDPRIFDHALAGLGGLAPERAAHVGDIRRTDVAGALGMGMLAVRYRGISDDTEAGPEGDVVLDDHADLAALLLGGTAP
jgi:putative hydrolase of the HAD superfamily